MAREVRISGRGGGPEKSDRGKNEAWKFRKKMNPSPGTGDNM